MNVELWKLIASVGVALIGAVTVPIIWAVRAEAGKLKAEIQLEIVKLEKSLKLEMVEMEKRLNERIDTKLVHR